MQRWTNNRQRRRQPSWDRKSEEASHKVSSNSSSDIIRLPQYQYLATSIATSIYINAVSRFFLFILIYYIIPTSPLFPHLLLYSIFSPLSRTMPSPLLIGPFRSTTTPFNDFPTTVPGKDDQKDIKQTRNGI